MGVPVVPQGPSRQRLHSHRYVAGPVSCASICLLINTDRELTLVPKKGRPVTQCQHCRLERKKRSAHVRCDCGELEKPHHSREKCIHLREAADKVKNGHRESHSPEKDSSYLAAVAAEQGCCCNHGGRCTCAYLARNGSEDAGPVNGPVAKSRLGKKASDAALTIFTNGHHKPVHRNHAAHESGMPYRLPSSRASSDNGTSSTARRSVEHLHLGSSPNFPISQRAHSNAALYDTARRGSKSEQHSPKTSSLYAPTNGFGDMRLSSIDFSAPLRSYAEPSAQSIGLVNRAAGSIDPVSGLLESPFDPWSAFPSADSGALSTNNPFGSWPTSFDLASIGQPALTVASSSTQSESDENPFAEDGFGYQMPSIREDINNDVTMLSAGAPLELNRRSLPPGFFGNTDFGTEQGPGDWPVASEAWNSNVQGKARDGGTSGYNETWQVPSVLNVPSIPQQAFAEVRSSSQPRSRSNLPDYVQNQDVIKQLFPDFDADYDMFASNGGPQIDARKGINDRSRASNVSAPSEVGPMDEVTDFNGLMWDNSILRSPNDIFTNSYDMDQDFTTSQYDPDWSR